MVSFLISRGLYQTRSLGFRDRLATSKDTNSWVWPQCSMAYEIFLDKGSGACKGPQCSLQRTNIG